MSSLRKSFFPPAGSFFPPPLPCFLFCTFLAFFPSPSYSQSFPDEEIYVDESYSDELFSDLRIYSSKWPDCYSDRSAATDIFRLEGVQTESEEAKALALWKWFRILAASAGGGYTFEGEIDTQEIVHDPHKILSVYGHHQCDGLSWAMTALWRAAGFVAFDSCTEGHTVASLRYRDSDGIYRFHDFDPVARFYYWDVQKSRIGTWGIPVMAARVHRHLTAPQNVHTLSRGLKSGESIVFDWQNKGRIIPTGLHQREYVLEGDYNLRYYSYKEGRRNGVYAVAGEEIQTFRPIPDPLSFRRDLQPDSSNTACSGKDSDASSPEFHPEKAGTPSVFIYRIASPYPLIDGKISATLHMSDPKSSASFSVSRDSGKTWKNVFGAEGIHRGEAVSVELGREARRLSKPDLLTSYGFLVKLELNLPENADPKKNGISDFEFFAARELNKRTLPNLRDGLNIFRVNAKKHGDSHLLSMKLVCSLDGRRQEIKKNISEFPFYFAVDCGEIPDPPLKSYDEHFNSGKIRMDSISFEAVEADGLTPDASLSGADTEKNFLSAFPHPADLRDMKIMKTVESDPRQTDGFLPQRDQSVLKDEARLKELISKLKNAPNSERWKAADELSNYPESADALIECIPDADGDLLLFICKSLAILKDPKAAPALLERWKKAPSGAPGSRYIPDVLASIGNQEYIDEISAPLEKLRFDFRFHIAYAMRKLGGDKARKVLEKIAEEDPFPALRLYAEESILVIDGKSQANPR